VDYAQRKLHENQCACQKPVPAIVEKTMSLNGRENLDQPVCLGQQDSGDSSVQHSERNSSRFANSVRRFTNIKDRINEPS